MTQAEVEARLGPPDLVDTVTDELRGRRRVQPHTVYLFPRDLAWRLARHPEPSLHFNALELTYLDGRLARIGDGPPVRSSGPACTRAEAWPEPPKVADAAFKPFQRFLGVSVGNRLGDVRRELGPWESINRSGDFVNYSRVTLDVDEDPPTLGKRVNGFAIGSDENTVVEGGWVDVAVDHDPATCLVRGFRFVAPHNGG